MINTLTGRKYIGRKYSWFLQQQPGTHRRKRVESDWQSYWGSSDELTREIAFYGAEWFERIIVGAYLTRRAVNAGEISIQIALDVLKAKLPNGRYEFYNRVIPIPGRYQYKSGDLKRIHRVRRRYY